MNLKNLIYVFVILSTYVFADGDKMFKVSMNQFKEGEIFESNSEMAITVAKAISNTPKLPLKENSLYLRLKKGAKEYLWIQGNVNFPSYQKLHAFNLSKNHLSVYDVVQLRFYPTKNSKAFQDESEIYFDKDYIYSSRVPKLFFMKNDRWQVLNEDSLPGMIKVEHPEKSLKILSLEPTIKNTDKIMFPITPGAYTFIFSAEGYLPITDIGVVQSKNILIFKPSIVKNTAENSTKINFSTTIDQIYSTENLETTEYLYDQFIEELKNNIHLIDTNEFSKVYPQKKSAMSLGLDESNYTYSVYSKRFDIVRAEAKDKWRNSKLPGVSKLDSAFKQRFDSLQQPMLRIYLAPDSIQIIEASDSVESNKNSLPIQKPEKLIALKFGTNFNRYEVSWIGIVPGFSADSLMNLLNTAESSFKIIVTIENNKPAWIYDEGGNVSRHHYRYTKFELETPNGIVDGIGKFVLPEYILAQEEVQEWLKPKPIISTEISSSSIIESSSSLVESSSSSESPTKIINDSKRGQLVLLDSGSFRYYGNVVNMSPFAIMSTEMTQELFEKIMMYVDSSDRIKDKSSYFHPQKPVHNINWNNARKVCKVHGGDLPTEAQWEYAGRAGSIEGALWNLDSIPNPGDYAIYAENSYNTNKQSESFGPQKVASKKPNAWGIYDMSGNVSEWTRDNYFMFSFWIESSNPTGAFFGYTRVYKGGSWKDNEKWLNLTTRDDEDPRYWSESLGFRCVYPLDVIGK